MKLVVVTQQHLNALLGEQHGSGLYTYCVMPRGTQTQAAMIAIGKYLW